MRFSPVGFPEWVGQPDRFDVPVFESVLVRPCNIHTAIADVQVFWAYATWMATQMIHVGTGRKSTYCQLKCDPVRHFCSIADSNCVVLIWFVAKKPALTVNVGIHYLLPEGTIQLFDFFFTHLSISSTGYMTQDCSASISGSLGTTSQVGASGSGISCTLTVFRNLFFLTLVLAPFAILNKNLNSPSSLS